MTTKKDTDKRLAELERAFLVMVDSIGHYRNVMTMFNLKAQDHEDQIEQLRLSISFLESRLELKERTKPKKKRKKKRNKR